MDQDHPFALEYLMCMCVREMRMRINEREGGWQCGRARCQENLSLKKDRAVWKCALSLPEERGTVPLEVCKAVPLHVMETWWDNLWILGQAGRSLASSRAARHLPVFRACRRFTCSPTTRGSLFSPFLFPPTLWLRREPRRYKPFGVSLLARRAVNTLLEKCSPLSCDLVKAPTSAEIWFSHLGSS